MATNAKTVSQKDSAMFIAVANAISGAVGGVIAMTIVFPLDVVRCKLQAQATSTINLAPKDSELSASHPDIEQEEILDDNDPNEENNGRASSPNSKKQEKSFIIHKQIGIRDVISEIYKKDGISGFYNALPSALIGVFLSDIIYFFVVTLIKQAMYGKREVDAMSNLKSSTIAGLVNVFCTAPYWRAQTQLMLQSKRKSFVTPSDDGSFNDDFDGILDAISKIYKSDGMSGLYKGVRPSILLVSNPIIQFVVYEECVNILKKTQNKQDLPSLLYFICGAIGKTVATLCTYPLQVMQTQLRKKNSEFKDMADCSRSFLFENIKNGNFAPLFSGLNAKLYQTVSNAAIKFMIYEKVLNIVMVLLRSIKKAIMALIFLIFVNKTRNNKLK